MDVEIYKKILKERNMTYEDLATQTGLSLGCIKRIMAGIARYPRIDTIELIEKALELHNEITIADRQSGWIDEKKESISPLEYELLSVFREIGDIFGEKAQRNYITVGKNMIELK